MILTGLRGICSCGSTQSDTDFTYVRQEEAQPGTEVVDIPKPITVASNSFGKGVTIANTPDIKPNSPVILTS